MDKLYIRNWEKWQSYRRDRGAPPWIKVHRVLLTNQDWGMLSDAEKGHVISIWMVASTKDGEIPADPKMLRKLCLLDEIPDVKKLIKAGFLTSERRQGDATVTPERQENDTPEENRIEGEENRTEGDGDTPPPPKKYGVFENVRLSDAEMDKLLNKFNEQSQEKIDALSEYMRSKGKTYKDHYATILSWDRRDNKGKTQSSRNPEWMNGAI